VSSTTVGLRVAQGSHRVEPCRTPRWQVRCCNGVESRNQWDRHERDRVEGLTAEEEAAKQSRHDQRRDQANAPPSIASRRVLDVSRRTTRTVSAPSAMRMPTSRVRWAMPQLTTP